MSLTTVYDALNGAITPDRAINLWTASNNAALPGLRGVLEPFGINNDYLLSAVALSQGVDSVTLTGTGAFGQPGDPAGMRFSVRGTLRYMEPGGTGVFTLSLAVTAPVWTFDGFFNPAELPPCQQVQEPGSKVLWVPSFLIGLRVDQPVFSADSLPDATLRLTGFLAEAPVFGPYRDFIGPWPLSLSGPLTMPANWTSAPKMTLKAVAAGSSSLTVGREAGLPDGPSLLQLKDLGFELVSRTDLSEDDWGRTSFAVLNLVGRVIIGGAQNGITADLTTQVLTSSRLWHLTAEFDPPVGVLGGLAQLTTIFGLPALPLPEHFPLIDTFKFQSAELFFSSPTYVPSALRAVGATPPPPVLQSLAVTIGSENVWEPPIPFVKIHEAGTRWLWSWSRVYEDDGSDAMKTVSSISGSVYGTFNFGSGTSSLMAPDHQPAPGDVPGGVDIAVSVALPELFTQGGMKIGDIIPLSDAFRWFFNNPGPTTTTDKIANVTALGFSADPIGQIYHASADIVFTTGGGPAAPGWEIDLIVIRISLEELSFWIDLNAGRIGGGISGVFALLDGALDDDTTPRILLQAEYPIQDPEDAVGWNFSGFLYPGTQISLTRLVARFLGLTAAPEFNLTVDRLNFTFSTGNKSYSVGGTMTARWNPEIFNTPLRITAAASIDIARDGGDTAGAMGRLSGMFAINKISIEAAIDVGVPERTYQFKVMFAELWFQAITSWRGEPDNRHQAISLQLGGTTLGDILEYLVNLAEPTIGFSLDPPWDVLKRIDLSRFVLSIDPQENVVEFVFKADVDLTIAKITSVGARYTRGGRGRVDLILEGSFLGQKYEGDKALKWDVINDPPPAVPGQGTQLVDLRYLGIGQRIRIANPPATVRETLALLAKDMRKVDDPKNLPGGTGPIVFSAESQWLIGLDIGLMGNTVDLGIIFNDPVLYGLSIGLNGEKAGPLAGLRFEILYKKITDTIGMFRIELRLPDAFRTFQIGIASFTLGTVVVEIYTNGNFMIDLGFPYNRNFEPSFSVQALIFIGRGGIYFGLLNGATSSRVPRITNGNFSPVIELGIGLSAGVGREIRAGILAGGAYVQIEIIFQGALGWFNPDSQGTAPARYFWAQGIVAIHGKVYGYIDFKIIKVSVSLEAYAQASAIFESYRPTIFRLDVSVRAEAEVTIVFFTISFSFNVSLSLDFTLGNVEPTPWILAPDQPVQSGRRLVGATRRDPLRLLTALADHHVRQTTHLRMELFARGTAQDAWGWNPDKQLWPDGTFRTAHLSLVPAFTIGDVPLSWNIVPAENDTPLYRAAFVLCADTGVPPTARTAAATRTRSAAFSPMSRGADDTDALTPDLLVQVFLLYSLYSIPNGPAAETDPVSSGQMALLIAQLESPLTPDAGFALGMLNTIFDNNLHMVISGAPAGVTTIGGMIAPLPPYLSRTSPQGGDIDFNTWNAVGPWYEWGISSLMGQYFPVGGAAGKRPEVDDPAKYESFAAYLFRDYCLMLAKAAVKEAQGAMRDASVVVTNGADGKTLCLRDLAGSFTSATVTYAVRAGDTVASVAEAFGATASELNFLNTGLAAALAAASVGTSIPVTLGIAPEVIAHDNAAQAFALSTLALGTVPHQVAVNETLAVIAELFHVTDLISFFQTGTGSAGLGASPGLLRTAPFDYPARTWTATVVLLRAAAIFFARYTQPSLDQAGWYAQAIFDLNPELMPRLFPDQTILYDLELPPGQTLSVPAQFNNRGTQVSYVTVNGDTLSRIGTALTLEQVYPTSSPDEAPRWQEFLAAVTSAAPGSFGLPAWQGVTASPGETLEALCRRLIVDATWTGTDPTNPPLGTWQYNWAGVVPWLGGANILAPLAVVPVPGASAVAVEGGSLSFGVLLQTYGIPATDAASRLTDTKGLYAENTTLTVTALPVLTVKQLLTRVLAGESLARIVNQASRSLMAGLQLPALAHDPNGHVIPSTTEMLPLYDISGQQFSLAVSTDPTRGGDIAMTVSVSSQAGWITFANAEAVRGGDDFNALLGRHPAVQQHSPGIGAARALQAGMQVLTGALTTLDYSYTNDQVIAQGPATGLVVPIKEPPSQLPLRGTVPRTYGLDHRIELQSPVGIPIPATTIPALSGQPGIWPFPTDLLTRAMGGAISPYEVLAVRQGKQAGRHAGSLTTATWGCLIPFRLRLSGSGFAHFDLASVDMADRQRLLDLIAWLAADTSQQTVAFMLADPAPNAGNTSGLVVLPGAAADTWLMKTNLSTETVPPQFLTRAETNAANYYANLGQLAEFLTLLWEGAVVGGIGYYLGTRPDLPAGLFDGDGYATLRLLIVAGTQQTVAPEGRPLLAFNNCALVGPALDAATSTLFVESYDDSDMVAQALVPPGSVGFQLRTDRPDASTDKEQMLRRLYSLLTFAVPAVPGGTYTVAASGMPIPPQPTPTMVVPRWMRERQLRRDPSLDDRDSLDPKPQWTYDQVVPMYRFGPGSAMPDVPGLPAPASDPYRGYGTAAGLPQATFQLGFGDIFGNRTAPSSGQPVPATVGYTDPLIGVTEWPGSAFAYQVEPALPNGPALSVSIVPRPSMIMPSPAQGGAAGADTADRQAMKYAEAYYQLGQSVTGRLITTLKADTGPDDLAIDISELWRYVTGAYAFSASVARLGALTAPSAMTLAAIRTTFNVRFAELAVVNAEVLVTALFGTQPLTVPAFVVFAQGDSAASIAAASPTRPGWPAPASEAILKDAGNGMLPLKPGAILTITPTTLSTGTTPGTLAALAAAHGTTPALLATGNAAVAMLKPGYVFSVEVEPDQYVSLTVTAGANGAATDSFATVTAAFAALGVNRTTADLAETNADRTGMLEANVPLASTVWVAAADETLARNGSGLTQDQLATLNTATPDLFDAGALIYLGDFAGQGGVTPDPSRTLRQFAQAYACPIELLLQANAGLALPDSNTLTIPGTIAWPKDISELLVPYTLRSTDTLNGVAARFAYASGPISAGAQLARQNANMPLLLVGNLPIAVNVGGSVFVITTPAPGTSFAAALLQVRQIAPAATMDDLAAAVGPMSDALRAGMVVLCPPCQLATNTTPDQIPGLYTIDAALFALANAATPGLIASGLTLASPDGSVSVTTRPGETFNSLIVAFATQDVQLDAAAIVNAAGNRQVAFLRAGHPALLPPAPARVGVSIGMGAYPGPVFPLSVAVRLERPASLIHPDFDAAGPVQHVDSVIPAPVHEQGTAGEGSLTFEAFIKAMNLALPALRIATGKTSTSRDDLWAVNFGATGITSLTVKGGTTIPGQTNPQPRYFGLKPLYATLVTRTGVPIRTLTSQGTLSEAADATDFQGVDAEGWASRFLADMDRFLGADFATGVYLDPVTRPSLQSVLESKATLVTGIARGMGVILNIADPLAPTGLVKAREALEQQLGISLFNAYSVSTVVQFDRVVVSPWQTDGNKLPPANLYGQLAPGANAGEDTPRTWTTTSAKTWLDNSNPFVTFLLIVSDPASHRDISATLEYDAGYIEHNISAQGMPNGYVLSDWLSFVPPLAGADRPPALHTDLGLVTVPIALRNFPALPIVMGQTAGPSEIVSRTLIEAHRLTGPTRASFGVPLDRMPLWDYGFAYSHQHAEQDEVNITVQFNLRQGTAADARAPDPVDLFTELAKYIAVADPLWTMIEQSRAEGSVQGSLDLTPLQGAVQTLATLARNVATNWTVRLPPVSALAVSNAVQASPFTFRARVTDRNSASGGREIDSLTLTSTATGIGPDGKWPNVWCRLPDGSLYQLLAETVSPTVTRYNVAPTVSIPAGWPVFTLRWIELNVSKWQNATGFVSVQRNQRLLGDQGPETNPDFVFRTGDVHANDIVTPLNIWSERREIIGTPGLDYVKTALTNAFTTLFPGVFPDGADPPPISMGISYAFELAPNPDHPDLSLVSEVPIALYPDQMLNADTAGVLQGAVNTWKAANHPETRNGEWVFALTLCSSLTTEKRPLLVTERLFCGMDGPASEGARIRP